MRAGTREPRTLTSTSVPTSEWATSKRAIATAFLRCGAKVPDVVVPNLPADRVALAVDLRDTMRQLVVQEGAPLNVRKFLPREPVQGDHEVTLREKNLDLAARPRLSERHLCARPSRSRLDHDHDPRVLKAFGMILRPNFRRHLNDRIGSEHRGFDL